MTRSKPQPRPELVALDRNPNLPSPDRWEPTPKSPGDVIVTSRGLVTVEAHP